MRKYPLDGDDNDTEDEEGFEDPAAVLIRELNVKKAKQAAIADAAAAAAALLRQKTIKPHHEEQVVKALEAPVEKKQVVSKEVRFLAEDKAWSYLCTNAPCRLMNPGHTQSPCHGAPCQAIRLSAVCILLLSQSECSTTRPYAICRSWTSSTESLRT